MRIGLDALCLDATGLLAWPFERLVNGLGKSPEHSIRLYVRGEISLPPCQLDGIQVTRFDPDRDFRQPGLFLDHLSRRNPDELDWLIAFAPLRAREGYAPAVPMPGGPKLAAWVTDLDPWFSQDAPDSERLPGRYVRALATIRRYVAIITPSESVRQSCLELLRLEPSRVFLAEDPFAALSQLDRVRSQRTIRPRIHRRPARPRLAFFSPLPPMRSGVADYADRLVQELVRTYEIDLFHDGRYAPDASWVEDGPRCFDARLFEPMQRVRPYDRVLYQMGNSIYHHFLHPHLLNTPGVTTLHDFNLANFHTTLARRQDDPRASLAGEFQYDCPNLAGALLKRFDPSQPDIEPFLERCSRAGAALNRRVFERSRAVVVHSRWCVDQIAERWPELASKATLIPIGSDTRLVSPQDRPAIRARFGLPERGLILGVFGFIHPDKLAVPAIRAFAEVTTARPDALLVLAGQEADAGQARREVEALGLTPRVQFLGRRTAEEFADLMAVTDLAMSLRRPPTNGETSAALVQLLGMGVATIVTAVGTFAEYPDDVVCKVGWDEESGPRRLSKALHSLVADGIKRAALGRAAHAYVAARHDWTRVAERYVDVIERHRADGSASAA